MIASISNLAHRNASGRNIIIFFVLQITISGVVLPYLQTRFDPQGVLGVLDLKFGFTPDEAYQLLSAYGEEGRKLYFVMEACIDIIYPVFYTITNLLLLSFVFKRGFQADSFMQNLNVFPMLVFISDILENAGNIAMLKAYPERINAAASLASTAGIFKWTTFGISIALFLTGLVAWASSIAKRKKN
ncbi:hypothetical protein C0V77_13400 [Emticicia sp. TH156]|nr:hypothetical protein C0V77_13400 [Emticicia sp. TH156]